MMNPLRLFAGTCVALLLSGVSAFAEDGFQDLFDGQGLGGWIQQGGAAKYAVEDGVIVGTAVPNTSNSFLCTQRHYRDFELQLDFKVSPELNSGIQIRSNAYSGATILAAPNAEGGVREMKVAAGRVHGYQVEIDPSERAYSGGIYDEGRRGWLFDLKDNEPARKAFKSDDWNHFRIRCKGDHIQTWINDVPAADLHDDMLPSGFIALQVHGIGNKNPDPPLQVRWRNIRIQELWPAAKP